jgi:hypothetical protein
MCLKLRKIKMVYMVDYMNPRSTYSLKVTDRASRDSLGSIYVVAYMFFICTLVFIIRLVVARFCKYLSHKTKEIILSRA